MKPEHITKILEIVEREGVFRAKTLRKQGIHQEYIRKLDALGLIERVGNGTYSSTNVDLTEYQTLIEASVRVPHGVICLLSALCFHNVTTQSPFEVWLAIANKVRPPKEKLLPLRIIYMSGQAFSSGVEEHRIMGHSVKVYNLSKTVVDCFKYRNKIGLDVALEALRESWHQRLITMDSLWHYAKICRMTNVMRPYLESLT